MAQEAPREGRPSGPVGEKVPLVGPPREDGPGRDHDAVGTARPGRDHDAVGTARSGRAASDAPPGRRLRPGDAARSEGADTGQGFSASPARFAAHAVLYYAGKIADNIVSLYSKAFRLDREYVADFNRSTGEAHAKRGRWEDAIPLLEKALAMAPDDHETRMRLAEAYGAVNQYGRACLHLERVLEGSPDSARALRALGMLHSRSRDHERAILYLEKAVKLDPDHPRSFYRLGAAYDSEKRYDLAVESFKRAIRLDPRFARAYQALGFTYESMGDRESAVECFKRALEFE